MNEKKVQYIRKGILVAAVLLIVIGIIQSGPMDMMNKAVRICYECIGIG